MAKFYSQVSQTSPVRPVKYYFAYGMNTNIGEMSYRCPNAVCIGPAKIKNYKLVFRNHADIERADDGYVHGVMWKITSNCEQSLDLLEGYPFYYDKKEFIVELDKPMLDMTHFLAMAYQMVDQTTVSPPSQSYMDCLIEGYTTNNVNVDQIYRALEESYADKNVTA